MRSVEAKGRTVDEAVDEALRRMNLGRDEVDVEVLEEPSRGLFGLIGAKEARVRVTRRVSKGDYAEELIREVFSSVGARVRIQRTVQEGIVGFDVSGEGAEIFIGRRGETLNALQFLVNVAAGHKSAEPVRIVLDIEGYKDRRKRRLEQIALRAAERARRTGERVVLEPMAAGDRRVIHLALQGCAGVTSRSEGEEPFRRVVVTRKR